MTAAVEPMTGSAPDPAARQPERPDGFHIRLHNFEGPFDLLLTLIGQQRLDVTEVALHRVTDDFIAYTKALWAEVARQPSLRSDQRVLDQTTQFLVVAATLLDLKAARLLPSGEVDDAEDLALLEARDLLFARLLQYRAFKQVAELFAELEASALRRYPRVVGLEERYAGLLPEVTLGVDADGLVRIAAAAFRPRRPVGVGLDHLHAPRVSVVEQARVISARLRERPHGEWTTFAVLTVDCDTTVMIVARFLALLELYRQRVVEFDQPDPLGRLAVAWTGSHDVDPIIETDDGVEDSEADSPGAQEDRA